MSLHSGQSSIPSEAPSHASVGGEQLPLGTLARRMIIGCGTYRWSDLIERLTQQVEAMNKNLVQQAIDFEAQLEKDQATRTEVARYTGNLDFVDVSLRGLNKTYKFETDHVTNAVTASFNQLAAAFHETTTAATGHHRKLMTSLQELVPAPAPTLKAQ
ncbi:unnamed protein product [Peniophora sp. CBMAI 1063]|nr:unnamed protein product [Peniophora sp. CBMAI 1063]